MHAMLALTLAATLSGVVTLEDGPLPGCTVTLVTADGVERHAFTDGDGAYQIGGVPAGRVIIRFELAGVDSAEQSIHLRGDEVAHVSQELELAITETITLACGGPPCSKAPPESVWDYPSCADFELNEALIEALRRGDRSAAALLESRFSNATTWAEKHTIAAALLGKVASDGIYWSSLYEHAAYAVEFPRADGEWTPEFIAWCTERGLPPEEYGYMALGAFGAITQEPRARQLVYRALDSREENLIGLAIQGLAQSRDFSAITAIERTLESLRSDYDEWVTMALAYYEAPEADAIARRRLSPDAIEEYARFRESLAQDRIGSR